jgi:ankyrin repeat protein
LTPDFFAFHIAANHERLCKLFVEAGLDVNYRDAAGTPMLSMAARNNRKELLEWLLATGADIDAVSKDRGYSAVMDAVWKSNTAIVKILVEKKANLNFISRDGQSVLVLAVGTGNEEICRLLVENGADPSIKDSMGMSAVEYARLFKKESLAALLEKHA